MEDLFPDQDGVVRAARVKVACSEGKPNLRRSIEQLIPLEDEVTERLKEMEGEADEGEDKKVEGARNKGT